MITRLRRQSRSLRALSAGGASLALAIAGLAGCQTAQQAPQTPAPQPAPAVQAPPPAPPPVAAAPATPAPPPPVVAFDEAIERAASALFAAAEKNPDVVSAPPRPVIIDPLVDGNSAQQTVASESMGEKIAGVISTRFPKFTVAPFRQASLQRNPLLLIGTLTAVNAANDPKARNDIYRICLALVDVRSGKIVAKGLGRATEQTVDSRPLPYYGDSPTWVKDRSTEGYIRSCQGTRAGDVADALYIETLPTAMLIDEAVRAYHARNYADAQRLYRTAMAMPAGEQRRVINGMYLTSWRLKQVRDAEDAFGKIVVRGLNDKKLGVKFLFKPARTDFVDDRDLRAQYGLWTRVIAQRMADAGACVAVVGHTSRSGDPALNDALSRRRAEVLARTLERQRPVLKKAIHTDGVGSREPIIGSGTDDVRDALDRRVEFKVTDCKT